VLAKSLYFFDKENILISRRYQLHTTSAIRKYPKDNTDAHNPTTKRKKMSLYGDQNLLSATQTTAERAPRVPAHKTMPSTRPLQRQQN
jgi:hypothetical protein